MEKQERIIVAIDLKSFYASVECLDRNLDPFTTPLVVADDSRGDGTIVLAASPYIKEKYHVKSRCRLYDVDQNIPGLIIAMPKMQRYLEVSALINSIYLEYVSEEDLFVYSIDECFLDCTKYLAIKHDTPKSYARKIIKTINERTGLTVTAGIGKNMFMAKACMDIEAKHKKDFLAEWGYPDIAKHLWPVTPLSKMWGIGSRLEKRLNQLGFMCVGDIACGDLNLLKSKFGVIGEEIYYHSLGYDDAILQESYTSKKKSLSAGQVLLRDYTSDEMPVIIQDMAIELSDRMHEEEVVANNFILIVRDKNYVDYSKKIVFTTPTNSAEKLTHAAIKKFSEDKELYRDELFRQIYIVAVDVIKDGYYQMSLFEDIEKDQQIKTLEEILINIRKKYGTVKAMPCSALTLSSTFINRRNQIGGHHV